MKALVWVLNIVQFLIAYFISYALYFYGILELLPPEIGLVGDGVWPIVSLGIAIYHWKFYNKFSNNLISKFRRRKNNEGGNLNIDLTESDEMKTVKTSKAPVWEKKYFNFLIISIAVLILIVGIYKSNEVSIMKDAEITIDREDYSTDIWNATLKTKWVDRSVLYIFTITTPDGTELPRKYDNFEVAFKDEDGFVIKRFELTNTTRIVDPDSNSNVRFGVSANSSTYMSIEDYLKISKWSITWNN